MNTKLLATIFGFLTVFSTTCRARATISGRGLLATLPPAVDCPPWAVVRTDSWAAGRADKLVERAKTSFRLAFFGDSITNHLEEPRFADFMKYVSDNTKTPLTKIGNFGISADTADSMMGRLCHGGLPKNVDVVVVHIGTNNLKLTKTDSAETIASKIFENVKYIRSKNPKTRVVLASIFKRSDYEEKRKAVNNQLWSLFSSSKDAMITFTTSGEKLEMINTTDGLHPTPAGWRQVYDSGLGQHVRKALTMTSH